MRCSAKRVGAFFMATPGGWGFDGHRVTEGSLEARSSFPTEPSTDHTAFDARALLQPSEAQSSR
jgi:hypothetical protein